MANRTVARCGESGSTILSISARGHWLRRTWLPIPAITVHLESGSEVVIIEGVAEQITDVSLLEQVIGMYNAKYRWDADPNDLQKSERESPRDSSGG